MNILSKILLLTIIIFAFNQAKAQRDSVIWNGTILFLPNENDKPSIDEISNRGPFVIYWYKMAGERFGRCYNYADKKKKTLVSKAIVRDRPDLPHITNWEFVGVMTYYYKDGAIQSQQNYEADLRNGIYLYYFQNGHVKTSGQYQKGKPVGKWVTYNSKGQKTKEKQY